MKKLIYLFTALVAVQFSFAQITAPGIEWQNTIGGGGDDLRAVEQTSDGGYILGGFSGGGINADKTEKSFAQDYWVVKTDATGNIQWQNTISGNDGDYLTNCRQTTDGGYIIGGYTESGKHFDKTENHICDCLGDYDLWILKLDNTGNIVWQNTLGSEGYDFMYMGSLEQTSDGNYIAGASATSLGTGDVTGTVEGTYDGGYAFWVFKLNNSGAIIWQKVLGGGILQSIHQTSDGGFIVGGYSGGPYGDEDYHIYKLDGSGTIQWDKYYGGNKQEELFAVIQTSDGGYIMGGNTLSKSSGNKTEDVWGTADMYYDYWVIKTDSAGNIQWQNDLGGNKDEYFHSIQQAPDGGYILGGYSTSGATGDKTEPGIGSRDYWIVKLNTDGTIAWQNTIGGTLDDYLYAIALTSDGGYILGGSSNSNISGDKTENSILGSSNYWVVKLNPETCIPSAEVCNGLDDNCDGIIDNGVVETISVSAAGPITFCSGGSVVLNASYSGTSVQWKKNGLNIPGATAANYTVTKKGVYTCATYSSCDTALSAPVNVNVEKNPTAVITSGGPTSFCAGGSVTLSATAGAGLSYQWYKGGSTITGATSINYTATTAGNYTCRVTLTATGCNKISNAILVVVPCREGEEEQGISIYPNPNNGRFNLIIHSTGIISEKIMVTDISGKVIVEMENVNTNSAIPIDLSNYSSGIYFVKIICGETNFEEKIVKE